MTGSVRWADFAQSGYDLEAVDGCGQRLKQIASVAAREMSATECCSSAWNAWWLEQLEIPEAATALGIFGWEERIIS